MEVKIKKATYHNALELSGKLREADKQEVWASHHMTPDQAVLFIMRVAHVAYSVFVDGRLLTMYGVSKLYGRHGASPWLLATDELDQYGLRFYRTTLPHVQAMLNEYGYLENYVDERNVKSIRWLKWLGFVVEAPAPFGVERIPFHRFWMRRS